MDTQGIAILGSTGSIGCNTMSVVESFRDGRFRVVALAAGRNVERLAEQVARHRPELVAVADEPCAERLKEELGRRGVPLPRVAVGEVGMVEVATHGAARTVVSATVGAVGFVPTLRALEAGKRVALANKETLVIAGELMTRAAAASGAEILPVDSEHNALHQCLRGEPTWRMGAKVTIDSATLMNKGLEVIEARWLFGFGADEIDIVVHPESVVHSMIELVDGSVIAQLGVTDMRHAIQYALTYPERCAGVALPPLDLTKLATLHFEEPDTERFPCLRLAYRALRAGGTLPAAMNAANEEAVKSFLEGRIRLTDIPFVIERVMDGHETRPVASLDVVLDVDRRARAEAAVEIARLDEGSKAVA
jgi:1-deoxy-D-xylulose-5-phosphate reductoisomerase